MNIGVVLSDWAPESGGAHTYEAELYRALGTVGGDAAHRFTIFHRGRASGDGSSSLAHVPIPARAPLGVRVAHAGRSLLRPLTKQGRQGMRQGVRLGWKERFVLDSGVDMLWYPTPACLTLEMPYVVVLWDLQHRLQPYFPEVSAHGQWEHREATNAASLRRAAAIITGTTVGKAEIERFYQVPAERIYVVPQPTPAYLTAFGENDAQVLLRHRLSPGYLFYPAQFWPHKNHAGLVEALAVLKMKHAFTPTLVLVGADKGNLAHVSSLAEQLGVAAQVRYLGFVPQADMAALYRYALATTFVTFFGPDNLPPLEAFACGCPVVASAVPGSREQLADAALLVDPKRPSEIADAIWRARQDEALRQALIERGRRRAEQFGPAAFVRSVCTIFDELEPIRRCWAAGPAARCA